MKNNNNTYTCAMCHQTYNKAWSDDEAIEETTGYCVICQVTCRFSDTILVAK
jgi:hypothetical protein